MNIQRTEFSPFENAVIAQLRATNHIFAKQTNAPAPERSLCSLSQEPTSKTCFILDISKCHLTLPYFVPNPEPGSQPSQAVRKSLYGSKQTTWVVKHIQNLTFTPVKATVYNSALFKKESQNAQEIAKRNPNLAQLLLFIDISNQERLLVLQDYCRFGEVLDSFYLWDGQQFELITREQATQEVEAHSAKRYAQRISPNSKAGYIENQFAKLKQRSAEKKSQVKRKGLYKFYQPVAEEQQPQQAAVAPLSPRSQNMPVSTPPAGRPSPHKRSKRALEQEFSSPELSAASSSQSSEDDTNIVACMEIIQEQRDLFCQIIEADKLFIQAFIAQLNFVNEGDYQTSLCESLSYAAMAKTNRHLKSQIIELTKIYTVLSNAANQFLHLDPSILRVMGDLSQQVTTYLQQQKDFNSTLVRTANTYKAQAKNVQNYLTQQETRRSEDLVRDQLNQYFDLGIEDQFDYYELRQAIKLVDTIIASAQSGGREITHAQRFKLNEQIKASLTERMHELRHRPVQIVQ